MNKVLLANIEAKKDGKELADSDVVQILQKTIKELTEERENYLKAGNQVEADNIEAQKKKQGVLGRDIVGAAMNLNSDMDLDNDGVPDNIDSDIK